VVRNLLTNYLVFYCLEDFIHNIRYTIRTCGVLVKCGCLGISHARSNDEE